MDDLYHLRVSRDELKRMATLGGMRDLLNVSAGIVHVELDKENGDLVFSYKNSLLLNTPEGKDQAIKTLLSSLTEIANPRSESERRSAIHARSRAESALHEFYSQYGDPNKKG